MIFFRNHYARLFGFCKTTHGTSGKAKGLFEANDIERVHRVEVGVAIRT